MRLQALIVYWQELHAKSNRRVECDKCCMLFCVIVGETSTNGLEMSLCHLKLNSGSHKILLNTGCPIPRVQRSAHNGTDQLIQTHIDAVRMIAPSVLLFLQTNVPQFGCMTLCVFCIDIYYSPCDRGKT